MGKRISESRDLHSASSSAVFASIDFPLIPTFIPFPLLLLQPLCDHSVFVPATESLFYFASELDFEEVTDDRGRIFVAAWNPPWTLGCVRI